MELQIEYLTPAELTPYERNAKIHDRQQIEQIKTSIQQFGMNDPIAVWKNNVIIEGHGRLIACKELQVERVPVIRLDHLTDSQRKAYCLAHNQLTMNTGFDLDLLSAELDSILDIDMDVFGFDLEEPEPEKEAEEDDFEPILNANPTTKLGQVWQLGRHRLLCGDSTEPEAIEKLMAGAQADLLITDPPYNVDYTGKTKDALKIENDKMTDGRFREFLCDAFKTADSAMKPGAPFYIWHADSEGFNFRGACRDIGWKVRQCLIWNKNCMVMGRQDYQWKHEPCLYGWKDGAGHYFIDDRTQVTVYEDQQSADFRKMKKEELVALLEQLFADQVSTTVLNEKKPAASDIHPTMKPLKLIGRLVKNSSKPEQIVLDTFGGSGSTLMVCEQLNRTCYTMELDPKYCDAIIERWETYTGEKAVLLTDKPAATEADQDVLLPAT